MWSRKGCDPRLDICGAFPPDAVQEALAVLVILGNQSAGGAGWPAVFIVEPGVHPLFFSLVTTGVNALEPLFPKVRGCHADPRMHEESAHPHLLEDADLPTQLLGIELAVPGPEGRPTQFGTRCGE